jgi:hypothetical protein
MWSVGGRTTVLVFGAVLLGSAGAVRPLSAQALSNVIRPAVTGNNNLFTPPAGLASSYAITITSDWNRPGIVQACQVSGTETVEGRLTWTGSAYVGVLERTSKYAECGMHGPDECVVQVNGSGGVQVAAVPVDDRGTPSLQLRWTPARNTKVDVTGSCTAKYREALLQLYRTTTHVITVPVPKVGQGEVALALEEQPWAVRVSP